MPKSLPLIILVAGHEYSRHGIDWNKPCASRERNLTRRVRDRPLLCVTIDISRGTVRRALYKTHDSPHVDLDQYASKISDSDYVRVELEDGYTFVPFKKLTNFISITDVYSIVTDLIKSQHAHIIEFSIFSHAYADGPILTNTYEFTRVVRQGSHYILVPMARRGTRRRDPNDLDPRKLDFSAALSRDDLVLWREAFSKGGRSRLWGCDRDDDVLRLMRAISRGSPRPNQSTGDQAEILVPLHDYERDSINKISNKILKPDKVKGKDVVQFGFFRSAVLNILHDTYAQALANATGATVYAAAPGTYAGFSQQTKVDMYVRSDTSDILESYRRLFGIELDPEGKGYIGYEPEKRE